MIIVIDHENGVELVDQLKGQGVVHKYYDGDIADAEPYAYLVTHHDGSVHQVETLPTGEDGEALYRYSDLMHLFACR